MTRTSMSDKLHDWNLETVFFSLQESSHDIWYSSISIFQLNIPILFYSLNRHILLRLFTLLYRLTIWQIFIIVGNFN